MKKRVDEIERRLKSTKMKILKCPNCAREKEVEDNIIIVVCAGCQIAMLPLKNYKEI